MSAIGGIFSFDGRPVPENDVETMTVELARRGPDQTHSFRQQHFASVSCEFRTMRTPMVDHPFVSVDGSVTTIDGRIDNRSYLLSALSSQLGRSELGGREPNVSLLANSSLIYAAYLKWGPQLIHYIIGDYFFSLVDAPNMRVVLGRDVAGARPGFYLHQDCSEVWWSSELLAFGNKLERNGRFNLEFIAAYLTLTESLDQTPFPKISAVFPGECLSFDRAGASTVRANLLPKEKVRLKADEEYEEMFRTLLGQSVERRISQHYNVACELSGGLDSSAIVCIANRQRNAVQADAALHPVSYLYDGSAGSDESAFIRAVERHTGLNTHIIYDHKVFAKPAVYGAVPNPQQLFPHTYDQLAAFMKSQGAGVLLSGHGGDNVTFSMGPSLSVLPEFWKRCGTKATGQFLQAYCRQTRRSYLQAAWQAVALHFVSTGARSLISREYMRVPSWVECKQVAGFALRRRKAVRPEAEQIPNLRDQQHYSYIVHAISIAARHYERERALIDVSYPFLDADLVRFLLALPLEQLLRPSDYRSVMKRSLRGILPEEVRTRTSKQGPDEPITRAIQRVWSDRLEPLTRDSLMAQLGYIKQPLFARELEKARFGISESRACLLRALSLEFWLQAWLNG